MKVNKAKRHNATKVTYRKSEVTFVPSCALYPRPFGMQATPYASRCFRCTLHSPPLQWFDLRARRIEEQLDFFLDPGHFQSVYCNDFISVVH
jgi:hypothetical protein